MATATTQMVRGITVEVRAEGFCWRATVRHLGGGGTEYAKYNGGWRACFQSSVPGAVYRKLRTEVRRAVAEALGK